MVEKSGWKRSDLTLSSVVRTMRDSKRNWSAMVSFCEAVMSLKETAVDRIAGEDDARFSNIYAYPRGTIQAMGALKRHEIGLQ